MTGDILPQFEGCEDRLTAVAFSEVYTRRADLKLSIDPERSLDELGEYPPEPSYLSAIVCAYRDDEAVRVRSTITALGSATPAEIGEQLIDGHETLVERWHKVADRFAANPSGLSPDDLALLAVEKAKQAKIHTVASLVIYSAVKSSMYYPALLIPKKTVNDVPLEFREVAISAHTALELEGVSVQSLAEAEGMSSIVKAIMQNDPRNIALAYFAAAINLPRVESIRQHMPDMLPPPDPVGDKYKGMTRAERRNAQLQERRNSRRNRS